MASLPRLRLLWTKLVSHAGPERSKRGIKSSPMTTTWILILDLEERGAFEPVALPSEIDALRDDAIRLAGEALVVAARDALARDDTSTVPHSPGFSGDAPILSHDA